MTGFCVRPRPRALVAFYGYGDIAGHWVSRPDPHYSEEPAVPKDEAYHVVGGSIVAGTPWRFYLYCRQQGIWATMVTGHDPDKEPEWFTPFCPIRNVTKDYPPTLLIHGVQDTDVPFQQSVLMSQELERQGVEHEFITLPNRGHMFDTHGEGMKDPVISELFDRVLAFLERQGMR